MYKFSINYSVLINSTNVRVWNVFLNHPMFQLFLDSGKHPHLTGLHFRMEEKETSGSQIR